MSVIWVLANQVWPVIGGLERVAFEQARLLAAQGHNVTYVGGTSRVSAERDQTHQGVRIRRIEGLSVDYLRDPSIDETTKALNFSRSLWGVRAKGIPELVIAHNGHRIKPEGLITALFEDTKYARKVNYIHTVGRDGDSLANLNAPWETHIAVSQWTLRQARVLGATRPMSTIYPGVDTKDFSPHGPKHAEIDALDGTVLLLPARIDPGKGLDVAVKALAEMRQSDPGSNFQLVLCRSGLREVTSTGASIADQRADLETLAEQQGVAANVHFFELSADDMPLAIRAADIVISPSTADEALCLAGPEAMACGKPVIATAIAGQRESVLPSTGILVEANDPTALADACLEVANSPELRQALVEKGHALVQERFAYQPDGLRRVDPRSASHALPLFEALAQGQSLRSGLSLP